MFAGLILPNLKARFAGLKVDERRTPRGSTFVLSAPRPSDLRAAAKQLSSCTRSLSYVAPDNVARLMLKELHYKGELDALARPAKASFASRSVRRALLTQHAGPGSPYRCGKSTEEEPVGYGRRERGPDLRLPQKRR